MTHDEMCEAWKSVTWKMVEDGGSAYILSVLGLISSHDEIPIISDEITNWYFEMQERYGDDCE